MTFDTFVILCAICITLGVLLNNHRANSGEEQLKPTFINFIGSFIIIFFIVGLLYLLRYLYLS